MILYRNDMFDKTNEGLFWLSETPDVPSVSWNSACTRVASFVVLKHKYTNKQYTIINTHLDHVSREARINGMGVIINKIESLDLKTPILMGDMNDVESSATYRSVTEYGFNDALKVADESYIGSGATFHHFGESLDNPRIDFFFTD